MLRMASRRLVLQLPVQPPAGSRCALPLAPEASKWCAGTCEKCDSPCGLLAYHELGCRCRDHFIPVRRT